MMFNCTHCGHSEMVHRLFAGECLHGQMKPKDGLDCDCPSMDFKPVTTVISGMTRSRASAKAAGSQMERITAEFLAFALADDRIERRTKNGSKDRGDITGVKTVGGGRVVIECKNTKRDNLPGWIAEAEIERGNDDAVIGVVVHKKHGSANPADQYVSMSLHTFALLLQGGQAT